jgi:hypothetical protein
MRRHLCKRHEKQAKALKRRQWALDQLRAPENREHAQSLLQIVDEEDANHAKAKEETDNWECTFCKHSFPLNGKNHVSIEHFNITAPRGSEQPLIKDYPPDKRPNSYSCHGCAVKFGFVTQKELDTGLREGRFLKS